MRETVVLDTSAIVSDSNALRAYPGKTVVLPWTVLHELDGFKKGKDELARNAREANRILDSLEGDMEKGIKMPNDIIIRVIPDQDIEGPKAIRILKPDDKILSTALWLKNKSKQDVTVVSEDLNFRIKARALGLIATKYFKLDSITTKDEIYSGYQELMVSGAVLKKFHATKQLEIDFDLKDVKLFPNQFVMLVSEADEKATGLGIFKQDKNAVLKLDGEDRKIRGIRPKNREQKMAMHLLMDKDIDCVSLMGNAGTGKTLLALAAALELLDVDNGKTRGLYERVFVTKPVIPVGKDIGYLPGGVDEKMRPWMGGIYDNLRHIVKHPTEIDDLEEQGFLEFQPLSLLRGRSLPKCIFVVDEAQNLNPLEIKTILSRAGMGSKFILTSDVNQIDHPYVDSLTNGAAHCIERFKDQTFAGHITLLKGERSVLATAAAELL
jgi:PhoH-like ATPase